MGGVTPAFAGVGGIHSGLLSIAELVSFVCSSRFALSPSRSKSASVPSWLSARSTTSLNASDHLNVSSFFVSNFSSL